MRTHRIGDLRILLAVVVPASLPLTALAQTPQFPVDPMALVEDHFSRCEGIAFNGEGKLFVAADNALWHISRDGEPSKVAELYSNLGLAPIGERDILMADFGPTNRFDTGPNDDGIVWRITPEGNKTRVVDGGLGDPNALLVLNSGLFLVSDDATDEIFVADSTGQVGLFTDAIGHPNGLALSADGATLYVAQIFGSLRPLTIDDRLWAIRLEENHMPGNMPDVVARLGEGAANDGLALDAMGRIYVAANGTGEIWRVDAASGAKLLIAEDMPGAASIAFGAGEFDHHAIYVTSTQTGNVWEVQVGIGGAELHR